MLQMQAPLARRKSLRVRRPNQVIAYASTRRLRWQQAATRSSLVAAAERQHTIAAAEAEGKTQRSLHVPLLVLAANLRTARRIELLGVERARQYTILQCDEADRCFDDAGRAKRVARPTFRRAREGMRGKQVRHQSRFDFVVLQTGRAVQVDVVDAFRSELCSLQRIVQRAA